MSSPRMKSLRPPQDKTQRLCSSQQLSALGSEKVSEQFNL